VFSFQNSGFSFQVSLSPPTGGETALPGRHSDGIIFKSILPTPVLMKTSPFLRDLIRVPTCVALLFAPSFAGAQIKFHGIGDLPGGAVFSQVRAATKAGGKIIAVGNSSRNPGSSDQAGDTAVRWTLAGGLVALPNLVVNDTSVRFVTASAITPDGKTIASRAHAMATGNTVGAVLVTNEGTTNTYLGTLLGTVSYSAANAISDNSSVVYGFSRYSSANGDFQAFRWTTATGMVAIPFLHPGDNGNFPGPGCCSADGNVMVGSSNNLDSGLNVDFSAGNQAFRYVHGTGVTALSFLPGGTWNYAVALTPRGDIALGVGDSAAAPNGEVMLWNARNNKTTPLGTPDVSLIPDNFGGLTADAGVVVENFSDASYVYTSFVRNRHGWFAFQPALQAAGVDLTGWVLSEIYGVSRDGTLVFGQGIHNGNNEGWVAEVPADFLRKIGHAEDGNNDEEDGRALDDGGDDGE
jgi:hypothetical protein